MYIHHHTYFSRISYSLLITNCHLFFYQHHLPPTASHLMVWRPKGANFQLPMWRRLTFLSLWKRILINIPWNFCLGWAFMLPSEEAQNMPSSPRTKYLLAHILTILRILPLLVDPTLLSPTIPTTKLVPFPSPTVMLEIPIRYWDFQLTSSL